jgi:hypothetical protein
MGAKLFAKVGKMDTNELALGIQYWYAGNMS